MKPYSLAFVTVLVPLIALSSLGCGGSGASCDSPIDSVPAGVTTAPTMTFYVGATDAATGTALAAAGDISFASGGCGPFGVYESGNGGEVATEIEMRLTTRKGAFAMADGVVVSIQQSSAPAESGEVEGVWIRYGENFVIKYVHVKDPIVSVGQTVSSGQRIGTMVASGSSFFWEAELREKSGSTIYAKPWNAYLTNATVFNSLFGTGNCTSGGTLLDVDGTTSTTASNWVNDKLNPAQRDVTAQDQPCSFPN